MIKRYPLKESAIRELEEDLTELSGGLSIAVQNIVSNAVQHADNYFNGYMTGATAGRQAAIGTTTSVEATKNEATGRLTATGNIEDTGFNILYAVEFGAGIAGIYGVSNTSFKEMGMGTGSWYGQTHAFDPAGWNYYKDGDFHHTYGTPATMPMHNTIQDLKAEMPRLIHEELRKWLT